MYPPLNPKGRISGSRSNWESTCEMVTGFNVAEFGLMARIGLFTSVKAAAAPVLFIKFRLVNSMLSLYLVARLNR
jgi:hypothetical protein